MSGAIRKVEIANKEYGRVSPLFQIFKLTYQLLRYLTLILVLVILASHEVENPKLGHSEIEFFANEFHNVLAPRGDSVRSSVRSPRELLVADFYSNRNYMPAWTLNFKTSDNFRQLSSILSEAEFYGLNPGLYKVKELNSLEEKLAQEHSDAEKLNFRAQLELTATRSALLFLEHTAMGIRKDDTSSVYHNTIRYLPAYLQAGLESVDFHNAMLALQPRHSEYVNLQSALARFMRKSVSDTCCLKGAAFVNNDSLIYQRLIALGCLTEENVNDSLFRVEAVQKFQVTHYLDPTGEINAKTLAALSVSREERFMQMSLNLDRMRKDALSEKNLLLVNIPEYRLHYTNQKGEQSTFNVMVGKRQTKTPLINSSIQLIVANPYWTVPKSITHNEIIPKMRQDSTWLARNGFSLIDNYEREVDMNTINWDSISKGDFKYWFRQTNNSRNALGVVKFLFPNDYSVYLHDTQSKRLFNRQTRAYSHGCIRVEFPEKLAQLIIDDYIVKENEIIDFDKVIKARERKELRLREELPILIRYYTCTADKDGRIYFHPDVYHYDNAAMAEWKKNLERIEPA